MVPHQTTGPRTSSSYSSTSLHREQLLPADVIITILFIKPLITIVSISVRTDEEILNWMNEMTNRSSMNYIGHLVNWVLSRDNTHHCYSPAAENNHNTVHWYLRGFIGLSIKSNDSWLPHREAFITQSRAHVLCFFLKNVSLLQEFVNSSVMGSSATSDWLQKTFCSEANKARRGPRLQLGGLQSSFFSGSWLAALSG